MTPAWLQEALSTVAGSTTSHGARLAEWAQRQVQASAGRADAARATAQRREDAMRDRIVAVAGAMGLLPTLRGWSPAVYRRIDKSPARYGFDQAPDMRTIRKARAYLIANGTTLPSCTPLHAIRLQTTSSST